MDMMCSKMIMKMQMTFYNDKDFMLFLYDWRVQTTEYYICALILLFIFATAVEFVRVLLNNPKINRLFDSSRAGGRLLKALVKTIVFFLAISGCYLLMLAVMTYSTGIFVAVCAGSALGYMLGKIFDGNEKSEKTSYSLHSIKS